MSAEELRQAEENDRKEWLAEAEARALADLPAACPVCDGSGYTDGVTVRHPCFACACVHVYDDGSVCNGTPKAPAHHIHHAYEPPHDLPDDIAPCAECGHTDSQHAEAQEVDNDGRPTGTPVYDFFDACVQEDRDGSSHSFTTNTQAALLSSLDQEKP